MKKFSSFQLLVKICLISALFPILGLLRAADVPDQGSKSETAPLQVLVSPIGSIKVYENKKTVASLDPIIFTEGWKFHAFKGVGPYPASQWAAPLDQGASVTLVPSVEVSKNEIHVHYSMSPDQAVSVVAAWSKIDLPYGDWQGASYQFGKKQGIIPTAKTAGAVIDQTNEASFTLGPSLVHTGLTLHYHGKGLGVVLRDSRHWYDSLTTILYHNEGPNSPWVWEKGQAKDFDFTLSFDKPLNQVFMQGPRRPFPFREENYSFVNRQAGVTLFGTLALPQGPGPFPAVEVISGAGPHTRDGYDGNSYFLVLTDELVKRGVAVFRYDKRGTGESSGDYQASTSRDFADDAASGVEFLKGLKEVDPGKIGLVGHSEGGVIAPMVAAGNKDVAFMILMAGTGVRGDRLFLTQREATDERQNLKESELKARKRIVRRIIEEAAKKGDDAKLLSRVSVIVADEIGPMAKDDPKVLSDEQSFWEGYTKTTILTPWAKFFFFYDPKTSLQRVSCPVLVVAGDKDWHVSPGENFPEMKKAFEEGKNPDVTFKLLPDITHAFTTYQEGAEWDSADPLQVIAPEALSLIGDWVEKHTK